MVGIGVIGYGYWGPNLVRNFAEQSRARIAAVSDLRREPLASVQRRYPSAHVTTSPQELIDDPSGDMWAPNIPLGEALGVEVEHFLDCIERQQTPITDGEAGLRVVRLLEAATQPMRDRGRLTTVGGPITVDSRR